MGADRLELDVHATSDGEIVVLHDPTLERTTDGRGLVRERTLAEVRRLDAGFHFTAPDGTHPHRGCGIRIPTLHELLDACPGVPLNIEVKQTDPPIVEEVLGVLDAHGAREQTLLAAEHQSIMSAIRADAPDVLTSHSAEEVAEFVGRVREGRLGDYRPPGVALQVPATFGSVTIVSAESVEIAHAHALEVHVWTVNDTSEIERLLELGVDAIMTDHPDRAARVFARRRSG